MRLVMITLLMVMGLPGQTAQPVNQISGSPPIGIQMVLTYSGTNLTYICYTRSSLATPRTVTVSAASNASPVSFTATAHGFDYQSAATTTPLVKITGGTGSWAAVNGVWVGTPTSANAFTIAVDSTAFGALTGTLVVTTYAPSMAAEVWSISKMVYDGSNNMIWLGWAAKAGGLAATELKAGSTSYIYACSSKTTYSYQ